jgi:hypothetical protein
MKKQLFVFFLLSTICISCAGLRADWRKHNEEYAMGDAVEVFQSYIADSTLKDKCKYDFTVSPTFIIHENSNDIKNKFGDVEAVTVFSKDNKSSSIHYSSYDDLPHEYVHVLNRWGIVDANGIRQRQSWECLDEISAQLVNVIIWKNSEIKRLNDRIKELRDRKY